jgi:molybdenum cofactor cytidylyltransferase
MSGARIAGVVLAAGASSRMGANKLLAPLEGRPMVRHVVETAQAAGLDPVLVVLGHQADAVARALSGCGAAFVLNPAFAEGLSTSLKAGLAALRREIDAAVILLGDMPDVRPDLVARMAEAFDPAKNRAIVAPTRGGRRGNPVLWSRMFFPVIRDHVHGDAGARALLSRYAHWLVEIEADDDGVFADFDTPEALRERLARNSAR